MPSRVRVMTIASSDDQRDGHKRGDAARLVDEDFDEIAVERPDDPGARRQRRLHRAQDRAKQDLAAILQDQRDAEREDELRIVPSPSSAAVRMPLTREISTRWMM